MKINKNYVVAGLVGVATITMGGVSAVSAAHNVGGVDTFGGGHRGGAHLRSAADIIGISVDDLRDKLDNGEKLQEIFETEGITKDELRAAKQSHMEERIAQAVASGKITQEEADARAAKRAEHQAHREAAHVAIENGDYDAWSTAVEGTPMADKVSEETFAKLVEAYELREAGDHEAAHEIMEELGIKKAGHRGGFGDGHRRQQ